MKPKELVITVAGSHGSGRTTQAKLIAEAFSLRYVSVGTLFRERAKQLGVSIHEMSRIASENFEFDNYLDQRSKEETKKGGVVLEATLSAWMAEDPNLRIYLTCPLEERVRRIAERECRGLDEVKHETWFREKSENKRFNEYYGIDLEDLTVYDLVVNTGLFDVDGTSRILKNVIEEYLKTGE